MGNIAAGGMPERAGLRLGSLTRQGVMGGRSSCYAWRVFHTAVVFMLLLASISCFAVAAAWQKGLAACFALRRGRRFQIPQLAAAG